MVGAPSSPTCGGRPLRLLPAVGSRFGVWLQASITARRQPKETLPRREVVVSPLLLASGAAMSFCRMRFTSTSFQIGDSIYPAVTTKEVPRAVLEYLKHQTKERRGLVHACGGD